MLAQCDAIDKQVCSAPQIEIRLLSDHALRLRITQYDGLHRNGIEAGDSATAEHYGRLLDLAWSEAAHRKVERRRRLGAV
jgi:hypothetical protein